MMIVVAAVAVCCRWPHAALAVVVLLGGPALGGWVRRDRGRERLIEGSMIGGAAAYVLAFVMTPLTIAAVGARSFDLAHLPDIIIIIALGGGFFGLAGMIVGIIVGGMLQLGVALVRQRSRRRQVALDRGRLAKPDGNVP